MYDFESLISVFEESLDARGDLSAVVDRAPFKAFLASELLAQKLARFADTTFDPEETAGLYEDNVVVFVLRQDPWHINLVRHDSIASSVYALPFASLIGPVGPGSSCALDIFDYPREIDADPGKGVSTHARLVHRLPLSTNSFWASSAAEPAYCLAQQGPDTIFLRVTGPMSNPYSHAFRRSDLAYSHSGFASPEVTCMDIFSNLMLASARAGNLSGLCEADRKLIADMLAAQSTHKVCAPTTAWNTLQALYAVDPIRSQREIERLAGSEGPLREVARKTLEQSRL
jgi:hypothetical protein